MLRALLLLIGTFGAVFPTVAVGSDDATVSNDSLTVEHYFEELSKHPSVALLFAQSHRYQALSKSTASLPDPELIVGVENIPANDPSFNRFAPSAKVLGFQQRFPNPSKRDAQADSQIDESIKQQLMAAYQLEGLKAKFFVYLITLKKLSDLDALLQRQLQLYGLVGKDLQSQLDTGKSVYSRLSEIDLDQSELQQRINTFRAEKVRVEEALIGLVGHVPKLRLPPVSARSWSRAETFLYPVSIASQAIRIGEKNLKVAQAGSKPSYGVQALYKQRQSGTDFDGDDWFSVQATISLPLWSRASQNSQVKAAQAQERIQRYAYDNTQRQWVAIMAGLRAEQKSISNTIELLKTKKAALKQMIGAAQGSYESGNTSLESVLNAQINYIDIAAKLIEQQSRYDELVINFNSHIQVSD